MNLWNKLTSLFSKPEPPPAYTPAEPGSSEAPAEPVETPAAEESVSDLFIEMLRNAGAFKEAKKVNAVELFVGWYDGPATTDAIKAALAAFKAAHPAVRAKLQGRL